MKEAPAEKDAVSEEASLRDEVAFVSLVEAYQERLGRFLSRMVGNAEDARDLVQETFLKAYRHRDEYRPTASPATWLFTIASNLARDYHRRRRVISFLPLLSLRHGVKVETPPVDESDQRTLVREVMASLPREMAECLYLYEVEGFKSPDLAKVLGISPEAVRQRVARARRRFREAYRALEGGEHGSR